MSKYRKKPVVIEAVQYDGRNAVDVMAFAPGESETLEEPGKVCLLMAMAYDAEAESGSGLPAHLRPDPAKTAAMFRRLAAEVERLAGDAETLRGYLKHYGETPTMTASSRNHWRHRAEAAEAEAAHHREALNEISDDISHAIANAPLRLNIAPHLAAIDATARRALTEGGDRAE